MSNVIKLFEDVGQVQSSDTVIFVNDGEIDMRAVTTMGMSAKDNVNAIGYFGTGLKYAIAVLLREGQSVTIYSGESKYEFSSAAISFRNNEFSIVTMNGQELGFTTGLGKNWEVWQAYRELHCNCTDEGGEIIAADSFIPNQGKTIIVCTGSKIIDAYQSRGTIILDTKEYLVSAGVAVHAGSSTNLFYKSIRALQIPASMFTYNILKNIELTEDRTIKYGWLARGRVMNAVLESHDKQFIKQVLTAPDGTYESKFNFMDTTEATSTPSAEFLDVAGKLYNVTSGNASAHGVYKRYAFTRGVKRKSAKLTKNQDQMLIKAKELCALIGYDTDKYSTVITNDLEHNTLGLAEDETIFVSIQAFQYGVRKLACVLMEEFIHIDTGMLDESRSLQNYLTDKIIDLAAEMHQLAV